MSEEIYKPLIEDMVWSYSRVSCYSDCPWAWYLKYIRRRKEDDRFYASYGSFVHKILEEFYNGKITKDQMLIKFLLDFKTEVHGERPQESTVQKYIEGATEYLKGFSPLPYNMIEVEKKIKFQLGGREFVGFIDYLGEKDGDLYIVDNKSGDIRPRSGRSKPTVKDKELDERLRQLYLYAVGVEQEYGKLPVALCFNCFRTGVFVVEPFDKEKYEEAKQWVLNTIESIENTEEFQPNTEYFHCKWICGYTGQCEHYKEYIEDWKWWREHE